MATIDNLTLEVNADITKAKKSLDDLSKSLTNLKTKMGTVGTAYKNLSKSLAGVTVSKDTTKAITNLANSLSAFNNVKASNLNALADTGAIISSLSKNISKVSIPTKNINAVVRMANALSTLNAVKADNIQNTATNLRLLFESIKKVSLSKQNTQQLAQIAKAGDSLGKLNQANPSRVEKTANNLKNLQDAMSNVTFDSIGKIERLANALSKLSGVDPKVLGGFGKIARKVAQTGEIPLTSGTTQKTKEIRNVITPRNIDSQDLSNWAKTMFKINAAIERVVPSFKALRKVVSTIGSVFKKAISPITRFLKALGRIAFYRAIRSILKEITQGLKEGIDNLAKYSKAVNEMDSLKANQVMSGYASYFLYLKNALGTAIMPLLKALLPLVEAVIQKFVNLLDILAQVGSAFFGMTYTSARLFWVDYADSLDNASRSAGKLHKQLAGFDELNNLTTNSGGGASWFDPTDAFKELEILKKIQEFVENLKKKWKEVKDTVADLLEPVKKVGDRLKDLWDRVVEKVSPHLDRIKDALTTIWNEGLKPLLDGLIEGFFEGYYGEEFESFPDLMGFLADKLADCAEKIADFVKNIDNDKIKEFGENVGYLAGFLAFMANPLNLLIQLMDITNTRLYTLGRNIGFWLLEKLKDLKEKLDDVKEKLDLDNDGVVELNEVITVLLTPLKDWILENVDLANAMWTLERSIRWVSDKVSKFTEKVQHVIEKIKEFFETINVNGRFDGLINGLDKIWQVAEKVKKTFEGLTQINLFEWAKRIAEMFGEGKFNSTNSVNIPARTNGGFVSRGDLFVANERGAEMVGSVNGNTAVANNQMITEAIAQATYQAMSQALSENGMNITIEGDSDGMFKVLQKKNREYKNMTGRSAFA